MENSLEPLNDHCTAPDINDSDNKKIPVETPFLEDCDILKETTGTDFEANDRISLWPVFYFDVCLDVVETGPMIAMSKQHFHRGCRVTISPDGYLLFEHPKGMLAAGGQNSAQITSDRPEFENFDRTTLHELQIADKILYLHKGTASSDSSADNKSSCIEDSNDSACHSQIVQTDIEVASEESSPNQNAVTAAIENDDKIWDYSDSCIDPPLSTHESQSDKAESKHRQNDRKKLQNEIVYAKVMRQIYRSRASAFNAVINRSLISQHKLNYGKFDSAFSDSPSTALIPGNSADFTPEVKDPASLGSTTKQILSSLSKDSIDNSLCISTQRAPDTRYAYYSEHNKSVRPTSKGTQDSVFPICIHLQRVFSLGIKTACVAKFVPTDELCEYETTDSSISSMSSSTTSITGTTSLTNSTSSIRNIGRDNDDGKEEMVTRSTIRNQKQKESKKIKKITTGFCCESGAEKDNFSPSSVSVKIEKISCLHLKLPQGNIVLVLDSDSICGKPLLREDNTNTENSNTINTCADNDVNTPAAKTQNIDWFTYVCSHGRICYTYRQSSIVYSKFLHEVNARKAIISASAASFFTSISTIGAIQSCAVDIEKPSHKYLFSLLLKNLSEAVEHEYGGLDNSENIPERILKSSPVKDFIWKRIGFQNESPQTDFRGAGVFGLLALLYFSSMEPTFLLDGSFAASQSLRNNEFRQIFNQKCGESADTEVPMRMPSPKYRYPLAISIINIAHAILKKLTEYSSNLYNYSHLNAICKRQSAADFISFLESNVITELEAHVEKHCISLLTNNCIRATTLLSDEEIRNCKALYESFVLTKNTIGDVHIDDVNSNNNNVDESSVDTVDSIQQYINSSSISNEKLESLNSVPTPPTSKSKLDTIVSYFTDFLRYQLLPLNCNAPPHIGISVMKLTVALSLELNRRLAVLPQEGQYFSYQREFTSLLEDLDRVIAINPLEEDRHDAVGEEEPKSTKKQTNKHIEDKMLRRQLSMMGPCLMVDDIVTKLKWLFDNRAPIVAVDVTQYNQNSSKKSK